ncbi:transposase [Vibrio algarum]|uniref:Transposase n=1 Tax=Vibrio algarum TaxID=3020714 RepID=A0ABT4YSE9_9VIBR|nr:transposase [Vibrio sp. KJ40-1]MDB1124471.1 transposase [Vibrio sp. KJ40-1]
MTTARKQLVCLESTHYYHCVSRCVRRSFLCGEDSTSGKSFEHRRGWIENKIHFLTSVYCIDICAYAVMSNHYHIVTHVDKNQAKNLTLHEVVERWSKGHKLPKLILKWQQNQLFDKTERKICKSIIGRWRARLCNLSWFMKELNYDIACRANKEDSCKGHFWESRFKSQALMDEQALFAAMAYVDLNPIRAGINSVPKESEYTSIKTRLEVPSHLQEKATGLLPFTGISNKEILKGIPFRFIDYLELIDWSARQLRKDKTAVLSSLPSILEQLNLTQANWLKTYTNIERTRVTMIGSFLGLNKRNHLTKRKRACVLQLDFN